MRSVKMLSDIRAVSRAAGDRWYVTNGITAVGPVNFELLTRGIEAGKVPIESFIRHEAWTVWKPLAEIAVVTTEASPRGEDRSAETDVMSDDITAPHYPAILFEPPPDTHPGTYLNVPLDELFGSTDDTDEDTAPQSVYPLDMCDASRPSDDAITTPRRLITPHPPAFSEGLFGGCATLDDTFKVLVEAAVEGAAPLGVLVHQVRGESAFVVRAFGPRKDEMLGARTPLSDPAMQAAAAGACVVAEPCPGPAGRAIEARLERLGVVAGGAAMFPIRVVEAGPARWPGRLFGSIELGRSSQLLPVEVAAIGELAEKFAGFIMRSGWA